MSNVARLTLYVCPDDGKDYIDIATKDNAETQDVSTWREIRLAANEIIQQCVSQPVPKGGVVTDLGMSEVSLLSRQSINDVASSRNLDPGEKSQTANGGN